ncbi:MAG: hypothetical protein D6806_06145, partial [Deltaproteobacteria bacterium]
LSQDGTYSRILTVTATVEFTVPAACYQPASCSQFVTSVAQLYPGTSGVCNLSGNVCSCSLDIPWNLSDAGTWTTVGNSLQLFAGDIFLSYYFCIDDATGSPLLYYSGTTDNIYTTERLGYVLQ